MFALQLLWALFYKLFAVQLVQPYSSSTVPVVQSVVQDEQ